MIRPLIQRVRRTLRRRELRRIRADRRAYRALWREAAMRERRDIAYAAAALGDCARAAGMAEVSMLLYRAALEANEEP
jgi:DNA-binding phage protein